MSEKVFYGDTTIKENKEKQETMQKKKGIWSCGFKQQIHMK